MQALLKQELATRIAVSLQDFPIPGIEVLADGMVVSSVAAAGDDYVLTLAEPSAVVLAAGDIVTGPGGPFRVLSSTGTDITVKTYGDAPEPGRITVLKSIDGRISEFYSDFCEVLRQKTGMPWRARGLVRDVRGGAGRNALVLGRKIVREPIVIAYANGLQADAPYEVNAGMLILKRGVWPKGEHNIFIEYETGFNTDEWPEGIILAASYWISAKMLLRAAGTDGNVTGFSDGGAGESYVDGLYGTEIKQRFSSAFYLISEYETAAVGG